MITMDEDVQRERRKPGPKPNPRNRDHIWRFDCYFKPEKRTFLEAYSTERGMSIAEVIRRLVDDLEEKENRKK